MKIRFSAGYLHDQFDRSSRRLMFMAGSSTHLPPMGSIKYRKTAELVKSGALSHGTLLAVHDLLHQQPPRSGIVSESDYRFWTGLFCNLAANYERCFGFKGKIDGPSTWKILLQIFGGNESDLPDMEYVLDSLGQIFTLRPAKDKILMVPAVDIPQMEYNKICSLSEFADSFEGRIAIYVVEQDCYEEGKSLEAKHDHSIEILWNLHDWYTYLIASPTPKVLRPVAHGIVRRLAPEQWRKNPVGQAGYYDRKLAQMLALENGLRKGAEEVTGYVERPLPATLLDDFLASGGADQDGVLSTRDELKIILLRILGRHCYLKRFRRGIFDFPHERSFERLASMVRTEALSGNIYREEARAVEKVFYDFYCFLRSNENEWPNWEQSRRDWESREDAPLQIVEEEISKERSDDAVFPCSPSAILRAAAKEVGPIFRKKLFAWADTFEPARTHSSRLAAATAEIAVEVTEEPPPKRPVYPTIPIDWEYGKQGLLSIYHLMDTRLVSVATANLFARHLSEDGIPDERLDGAQRLLVNLFVAYKVRGGSLEEPDHKLLRKVGSDFISGSHADDPEIQMRRRLQRIVFLFERIKTAEQEYAMRLQAREEVATEKKSFVSSILTWLSSEEKCSLPGDQKTKERQAKFIGEVFDEILAPDYANPLPLPERFRGVLEQRVRQGVISAKESAAFDALLPLAFDWLVRSGQVDSSEIRVEPGYQGMTPSGWESGAIGPIPVDMLIETGRLSTQIRDGCYRLIRSEENLPGPEGQVNRLILNIFASYQARGGSIRQVNENFLREIIRDFVYEEREQAVYTGLLRKLFDWIRRERPVSSDKEQGRYPMLLLDVLEAQESLRFTLASEVIFGKAEPDTLPRRPKNKSEHRQMRILLNLIYYYVQAGGNSVTVDRQTAEPILREYVKMNIEGHIARLQRLLDLERETSEIPDKTLR